MQKITPLSNRRVRFYSRPVRARSPLRVQRLDLLGYMF